MAEVPEGQTLYAVEMRQVIVYKTYVYAQNDEEADAKKERLSYNTPQCDYEVFDCEESASKVTHPETVKDYEIMDVVLPEDEEGS